MLNENTLSQLGYDRNLVKGDKFYDRVLQNNIENQVLASLLGSGEVSIGILKSPNFVSGSAGCKIDFPAGTAEFQTIVAGDYIKVFVQDAIPTSLHINDIWYDSNDDNKSYRAACVGADQITAGEWERVDNPTEWADVLDGATTKPANSADVTSANNQGVAWLNEAVGSELPTANTAAKCTDAAADQTSAHDCQHPGDYTAGTPQSVAWLTAGTIASKAIVLSASASDCYIGGGKTDFTNTDAGFILGRDYSDSNKAKFYIGDSTHYLNWTGAAINILGATLTAGTIQTASSNKRIVIASNVMEFYNATPTNIASLNGGTLGGTTFFAIQSPAGAPFYPLSIHQQGASTQGALFIQCDDYGVGSRCIEVQQLGDKTALWLRTANTSTGKVLEITQEGTGYAIDILLTNASASRSVNIASSVNCSELCHLQPSAAGRAMKIDMSYVAGTDPAIEINNDSAGRGLWIHNDKTTGTNHGFLLQHAGLGKGMSIELSNGSNTNYALNIENSGSGDSIHDDSGAKLTAAGVFTNASSRELKTDFIKPNVESLIEKIKGLEILNYKYKKGKPERHLTPMAEDFNELFELGDNESLSPADLAGLALIGVQYLLQKVKI